MARERHLDRAPIAEALIDIRATLPRDFDVEQFREVHSKLAAQFPTIEERKQARLTQSFDIRSERLSGSAEVSGVYGYFFWAEDKRAVAQFRRDGFTFNILDQYRDWQELVGNARKLWCLYAENSQPEHVSRVATRFINKLHLPGDCRSLDQYLLHPPTTPEGLPNTVKSFLSRVVIDNLPRDAEVELVVASNPALTDDEFELVIDVNAYEHGDFDPNSDELFDALDALRAAKNRAFFNSITEKTVEIFE